MPTIGLVVSTMNNGILRLPEILPAGLDAITVVHQVTGEHQQANYADCYTALQGMHVHIIVQPFGGLSKSRNAGINATAADYLLITDDDVTFPAQLKETLLSAIIALPDADIITLKAQTPEGKPFKQYPAEIQKHSKRSVARVSSIEILLKKNWITASQVQFDTTFGLGAQFPTGEEFIFLRDAMHKGAKAYFYPAYIAMHPLLSSGKNLDAAQMKNKGAMITRVYGRYAGIIMLAFAIRKHKEYRSHFTLPMALSYLFEGQKSFRRHD